MSGLRTQFTRAAAWTSTETYGSAAINFAFLAVLARLVEPADFGLAAAASVVTLFFLALVDAMTGTVVQHRTASERQLSTLFWLTSAGLVALYLAFFVAAPFIADQIDLPAFSKIIRVAALQLPMLGALLIPLAVLRRELRFRELAICQVAAALAAGIIAVALALRGAGYWALIAQSLALVAIRTTLLWQRSGFKPVMQIDWQGAQPLFGYTQGVIGFTVVNYWTRNLDLLAVGSAFGAQILGYYSLAMRLIGIPVQAAAGVLRPLLHPTLAAMEGDQARMRRAYLRLLGATALVTLPAGALLWVAAEWIVRIVWGTQMLPAAAIVRPLALLAAVQPINALSASVYLARDATSLLFKLSLAQAVITTVAIVAGLPFGVIGVAWAVSISYAIVIAPLASGIAAIRLLGTRPADAVRALLPGAGIASAIVVVAALTEQWRA